MSQFHRNQWERLYEQKKQELLEADCSYALQTTSFDDLQRALHEMADEYSESRFPDLINRLNPSLQHIKSFTAAITSASQDNSTASLIWGAVQATLLVS